MTERALFTFSGMKCLRTALLVSLLIVLLPLDGARAQLRERSPFPHFSAVDLDGAVVDTEKLAGKTIILGFWSIYCSSCIQEMPHLVALYNAYKEKGLVVLGINLDVLQPEKAAEFMEESLNLTVPYPTVVDDQRKSIANSLGVGVLPATILVDTNGTVQLFHVGYKPGFEGRLEEAIKKHLPAQ
jgi:thiol-disulfide isomerase/thioredoxin